MIDNLQACDLISSVTLVCDKATSSWRRHTYVEANGDGGDILAGSGDDGAERCLVISGDMLALRRRLEIF